MTTGLFHAERLDCAGRTATESRNVATARAVFEGLARSDFSALYSRLAPDATVEVVGLTPERLGVHATNPNLVPETFPNGMCFTVLQAVAEGDRVFVEWEDEAQTGKGRSYRNRGLSLFRFDADGRIVDYREHIDVNRFLEVL
jgi:ketosteroid isomerase-like protein